MSVIAQEIALREPKKLSADEHAFAQDAEFAALVERQLRFVFRIAYAILRNVHDAEDAAQDVFLKIYRTNAWKKMCDERAFLARAAWRMAVDRSQKNSPGFEGTGIFSQVSIEQQLIHADRDAAVARLVDALPDELRLPLVLSCTEGLRSQEIAKIMGIPDGTVRTRIARARKLLKEKLAVVLEGRHA